MEERYSHVHDVEVVRGRIGVEELGKLGRDEVDLLHIVTLGDQLRDGELCAESVVGLQVLDVWVFLVTSGELKAGKA